MRGGAARVWCGGQGRRKQSDEAVGEEARRMPDRLLGKAGHQGSHNGGGGDASLQPGGDGWRQAVHIPFREQQA